MCEELGKAAGEEVINAPVFPESPIEVVVDEDPWSFGTTKRKPKPPKENSLRREFHDHKYLVTVSESLFADKCEPRPNRNSNKCYKEVFLSHARLYTLAEKYGVEPLRMLVLHKL